MRSSVAPLSSSLLRASATFTSRAASSAVKPALSRRAVSSAARLPSTAAGVRCPCRHRGSSGPPPGCRTAGPHRPRWSPGRYPSCPEHGPEAGFSEKSRVVIPLQESTCGGSKARRQSPLTSRASAASSAGENRVRGSVTAARVRPKSSNVTEHSSGGAPGK